MSEKTYFKRLSLNKPENFNEKEYIEQHKDDEFLDIFEVDGVPAGIDDPLISELLNPWGSNHVILIEISKEEFDQREAELEKRNQERLALSKEYKYPNCPVSPPDLEELGFNVQYSDGPYSPMFSAYISFKFVKIRIDADKKQCSGFEIESVWGGYDGYGAEGFLNIVSLDDLKKVIDAIKILDSYVPKLTYDIW